jgi:hypothetical protein
MKTGYLTGGIIGVILAIIGLVLTAMTPLNSSGNIYDSGILYALLMGVGFVVAVALLDLARE